MEKTLIFSIKPKWVEGIIAGRKSYELRRRPPKISGSRRALIYETSPGCRFRAVCRVGPVVSMRLGDLWKKTHGFTCVSIDEFESYFHGTDMGHAIAIQDVIELENFINLDTLRQKIGFTPPQSFAYASDELLNFLGLN